MLYFDTSYLVRLYTRDGGWEQVRSLARSDQLACSLLGQAETAAAFHRKLREGAITLEELNTLLTEFETDSNAGAFRWIPFSPFVVTRLNATFAQLPPSVALRVADGIHLASAANAGFTRVFSNDARFLAAAPHFGLSGANIME